MDEEEARQEKKDEHRREYLEEVRKAQYGPNNAYSEYEDYPDTMEDD